MMMMMMMNPYLHRRGGSGVGGTIVPTATLNLNNVLLFEQARWNFRTFAEIYLEKIRCGRLVLIDFNAIMATNFRQEVFFFGK